MRKARSSPGALLPRSLCAARLALFARLARLALLALVPIVTPACFASTVTHGTEVEPPKIGIQRLSRQRPESDSPLLAKWSIDGPVVGATLQWSDQCHTGLTQDSAVHRRNTYRPDIGSNLIWALGGAGMAVGGGALIASSSHQTTSEKASNVPVALTLLVTGTLAGGVALYTQLKGSAVDGYNSVSDRTTSYLPGGNLTPCGTLDELKDLALGFSVDGAAPDPIVLRDAHFGLAIKQPIRAGTKGALVAMSAWPHAKELAESGSHGSPGSSGSFGSSGSLAIGLFQPGDVLAFVDLSPVAQFQSSPGASQEFSGRILEDATPVSIACKPRSYSADSCKGIDNDCDGFWDLNCGLRPGALQWTLVTDSNALSLAVTDPSGVTVVADQSRPMNATLEAQAYCPKGTLITPECTPLQNVFLAFSATPREGTYVAEVVATRLIGPKTPSLLSATLSMRIAGKSYQKYLSLRQQNAWSATLVFAIGPDRDGDAVIDSEDVCPDEPGPWDRASPRRGCPAKNATRESPIRKAPRASKPAHD